MPYCGARCGPSRPSSCSQSRSWRSWRLRCSRWSGTWRPAATHCSPSSRTWCPSSPTGGPGHGRCGHGAACMPLRTPRSICPNPFSTPSGGPLRRSPGACGSWRSLAANGRGTGASSSNASPSPCRNKRARLREVTAEARFGRALAVANRGVLARWGRLAATGRPPDRARDERLEATVFHFLMRAAGRATPHGAWAGVVSIDPGADRLRSSGSEQRDVTLVPSPGRVCVSPDLAPFRAIIESLAQHRRHRWGSPVRLQASRASRRRRIVVVRTQHGRCCQVVHPSGPSARAGPARGVRRSPATTRRAGRGRARCAGGRSSAGSVRLDRDSGHPLRARCVGDGAALSGCADLGDGWAACRRAPARPARP